MSSSSDRKRKADDFAGDEAHAKRPAHANPEPTAPHIPAPVWAHVLDYMPYGEVRSALMVGKIIAVEAVKHVQTLNIMNGWEMDVPSARRFPNVSEVNILSLVRFRTDDEEDDEHDFYLCETTAERIVPFIVGFQKLKRIRAGGIDVDNEFTSYDDARRYLPLLDAANSGEILRALVAQFIGALSTRLLPTTVESLIGITSALEYIRPCRSVDPWGDALPNSCKHCRKVLKYFPIKDLIKSYETDFTCFGKLEEVTILAERQEFKERCRELSEEYLVSFIRVSLFEFAIKDDGLCKRLLNMGVTATDLYLQGKGVFVPKELMYLNSDGMAKVDRLIALGFDPKSVSQHYLYDHLMIGISNRRYDVYDKSTFEFLVSRGFPFAEADLILLDKTKEPALKELREERDD